MLLIRPLLDWLLTLRLSTAHIAIQASGEGVMGDYVAVDPQGLEIFARKLRELSDCLAKDAPAIVNLMQDWPSTLSYTPMSQAPTSFSAAATMISRRADMAMTLANDNTTALSDGTTACLPRDWNSALPDRVANPTWDDHLDDTAQNTGDIAWTGTGDEVMIPWPSSNDDPGAANDFTKQGSDDAFQLQVALANPGKPWSSATITRIGQTLTDNQDNDTYLKSFYAAGGATEVFQVPEALRQNGMGATASTALSEGDLNSTAQQIVSQFATSYVRAEKNGVTPEPKMPPGSGTADGLPMSWSTTMFLKYGPSGDQWDKTFLSDLSAYVLADHAGNQSWLSVPDPSLTSVWADSSVVFNLLAQNPDASKLVTTGQQGATNAQTLVLIEENLTRSANLATLSDGIPQIILNVTAAGDSDPKSLESAVNIINALGSDPMPLPPNMTHALAAMSNIFTSDLAASANHAVTSISVPGSLNPSDSNAPTHVTDGGKLYASVGGLAALYGDIGYDKEAVASVNSAIAGHAFSAVEGQGVDSQAYLANLSALQGRVNAGRQNTIIGDAAGKDQVNADLQMWIGAVVGGFGNSSLPDGILNSGSQVAAGTFVTPLLTDLFPTGNASKAQDQAQMTLSGGYTMLDVAIAQGLLSRGVIPQSDLPQNSPWVVDGIIQIHNPTEQSDFEMWLSDEGALPKNIDSLDPAIQKQLRQRVEALDQLYLNTRTGMLVGDGKFQTS